MSPHLSNETSPNASRGRCPFSYLKNLVCPPKNVVGAQTTNIAQAAKNLRLNQADLKASIKDGTLSLVDTADWKQRYQEYKALQEQAPVYLHPSTRTWIVTGYNDVKELGTNPNLDLSNIIPNKIESLSGEQRESISAVTDSLRNWMIYQPREEHLSIKRVFSKAFNASATEMMTPAVREAALSLLENCPLPGSGETFDFMAKYARPLPTLVLARMMGVPSSDLHKVGKWTSDLTEFMANFVVANQLDPEIATRASSAISEMQDYFGDRVRAVRAQSDGTILAHVVGSTSLPDKVITDQCIHIIFGGNKVPEYMAGNAMYHVLRARDGYRSIVSSNALLAQAIDEAARFESPVQFITRSVLKDFSFQGQELKQGDTVYLVLGAANRDARFWASPDTFDLHRSRGGHLAFGVGAHTCVATGMVKSQLFEMLKVFTERYPMVVLAEPTKEPKWTQNATFHGLTELGIKA